MVSFKFLTFDLVKIGRHFCSFSIMFYVLHDKLLYIYDIERFSHFFGFDKYFCKYQLTDLKKIVPFYRPESKKYEDEVIKKRIETLPKSGIMNVFKSANGDKVLVFGSIHYHEISKKRIQEIIRNIRPDVICIEYDKLIYPRDVNLYGYKLSPIYYFSRSIELIWN
ncbi:hypothetical protein MXB_4225, partial [Myxobolus squamalis]